VSVLTNKDILLIVRRRAVQQLYAK